MSVEDTGGGTALFGEALCAGNALVEADMLAKRALRSMADDNSGDSVVKGKSKENKFD